jgi:hypothetical protein
MSKKFSAVTFQSPLWRILENMFWNTNSGGNFLNLYNCNHSTVQFIKQELYKLIYKLSVLHYNHIAIV